MTRTDVSAEARGQREVERDLAEEDDDDFDRFAYAVAALDLVRPPRTRVALCTGVSRVRVESGRAWGRGEEARWALLSIPARASRRAIALAVVELARGSRTPWALDVLLMGQDPYRDAAE
jgi:hypothetical protein